MSIIRTQQVYLYLYVYIVSVHVHHGVFIKDYYVIYIHKSNKEFVYFRNPQQERYL